MGSIHRQKLAPPRGARAPPPPPLLPSPPAPGAPPGWALALGIKPCIKLLRQTGPNQDAPQAEPGAAYLYTSCRNFLPLLHFAMAADELRKLPIRFQVCASPHHAAPAVAAANTTYNSRAHAPLQKLNSTSKSSWVRCAQYLCHHAAGTPANCAARQLPPVFSDCRRCTTARTCSAHLVLNHDAPTAHHVVVDAPLKSSTHAPAPFDTSSWYTAWRPLAAARCSGVDPPSFTAVTDAPACSRRAAALVRP